MARRKTKEWRKNISRSKKGKAPYVASRETREKFRVRKLGEQNPNWRGGITHQYKRIRESAKYREWRSKVFLRDKYTCIWCGDSRGGNLEADHIKPRKTHPELVFEVKNGRTLCKKCHRKTRSWGNRKQVR